MLFRSPFAWGSGGGDGQSVQFIAGDDIGQTVFDQTVACQTGFAFKFIGNNVGKKMVAIAFNSDVFAWQHI